MTEHRIDQVSIATTGSRQTPHNEFGRVLAATASSACGAGATFLGGVVSGSPVLSAAVSCAKSVFDAAASSRAPDGAVSPSLADLNGRVQDDRDYDRMYLQLQMDMQRESREFNAVSNIIKVRHDSAKAAINNIR
jgi:hypothetical protein